MWGKCVGYGVVCGGCVGCVRVCVCVCVSFIELIVILYDISK